MITARTYKCRRGHTEYRVVKGRPVCIPCRRASAVAYYYRQREFRDVDTLLVTNSLGSLFYKICNSIDYGDRGCWNYNRVIDSITGYGRVTYQNKNRMVHRLMYEFAYGPIPQNLVIDHLCRNHRCCNPNHLEAVTQRVNTIRGFGPSALNAQKTHCKWGHEFTDANTYYSPSRPKSRLCRACFRRRDIECKARKRAARYLTFTRKDEE